MKDLVRVSTTSEPVRVTFHSLKWVQDKSKTMCRLTTEEGLRPGEKSGSVDSTSPLPPRGGQHELFGGRKRERKHKLHVDRVPECGPRKGKRTFAFSCCGEMARPLIPFLPCLASPEVSRRTQIIATTSANTTSQWATDC